MKQEHTGADPVGQPNSLPVRQWCWCGLQNRGLLVRLQPSVPVERVWYSGCAVGFQPADAGSTPVARSRTSLPPRDEGAWLRTRRGQFESVREHQMRSWRSGCASDCQSEDTGSIPVDRSNPILDPPRDCGRWPPKPAAAGSTPAGSTIHRRRNRMRARFLPVRLLVRVQLGGPSFGDVAQLAERLTLTQEVVGSMPAVPANQVAHSGPLVMRCRSTAGRQPLKLIIVVRIHAPQPVCTMVGLLQ